MGYTQNPCYTLHGGAGSFNPLDSSNYYFGNTVGTANTNSALKGIVVPKMGIVRAANMRLYASTATGTNENVSMYLRLNDTTDYLIATVGAATDVRDFNNYVMNIPVVAGDVLEFKMVTPNWATNPTAIFAGGHIVIEI